MDFEFHEALHAVLDQVDAYRAAIDERGYSAHACETMAMQYHYFLLRQLGHEMDAIRRAAFHAAEAAS